ncbi:MAG: hypothetical protein KGN36_04675 [Acidobacteriota bacterium]|nr:hypothetical protein [Acidobacteriota bacterium]
MPARPQPYISVVAAARNDNHGGDMTRRMQACLDSWIEEARAFALPSEFIVVEWNPPAGRPPLHSELRLPADDPLCAVRFLEVPREIHHSLPFAGAIPFHQMIAKNAGVRRAAGEFVLATNIDILFSAELMRYLAERKLDPTAFYRMDRWDIAREIPCPAPVEDVLAFAAANRRRVCAREGTWDSAGGGIRPVETPDIVAPDSGIRLGRGWYGVESGDGVAKRSPGPVAELVLERPPAAWRLVIEADAGPSARDGRAEWQVLDSSGAAVASAQIEGRCRLRLTLPRGQRDGAVRFRHARPGLGLTEDVRLLELRVFSIRWEPGAAADAWSFDVLDRAPGADWTTRIPSLSPYAAAMREPFHLHTNACGDFTMMSRRAWCALRGYPEFPIWPTHLDALLCYTAYHAGFAEVILEDPMRVYHIEHPAVWTPDTEEEREARAAQRGVPLLSYQTFVELCQFMRRFNAPLIFCGAGWGLAGHHLPETSF